MASNYSSQWEEVYRESSLRHKNRFLSTTVVSWMIQYYSYLDIEDRKKVKCLGIGCGWGNNLLFLHNEGFDVYGDFSPTAVAHCNRLCLWSILEDVEKLSFKSNSIDFVVDRSSVQHNSRDRIWKIFSEIHRVLPIGGRLFSQMRMQHDEVFRGSILSENDIPNLVDGFSSYELEQLIHISGNGKTQKGSWLISCVK